MKDKLHNLINLTSTILRQWVPPSNSNIKSYYPTMIFTRRHLSFSRQQSIPHPSAVVKVIVKVRSSLKLHNQQSWCNISFSSALITASTQLRYNLCLSWSNLDLPKSKLDQSSLSCCVMFGCIGCHLFTLRSTDWFASARITAVSVISIQRDWINQLFDLWFHPLHSRIIKHKVIWCIDDLLRSQMRESLFSMKVCWFRLTL